MYGTARPQFSDRYHLSSPNGGIAPEPMEVGALGIATGVDLFLHISGAADILNMLAPTLLAIIMSWGLWRLIRRTPAAVWTPLFSLRAGIIVWLALGSLVPFTPWFGGEGSVEWIDSYYSYTPQEGGKVNLLFTMGTFVLFASIKGASAFVPALRFNRRTTVLSEWASLALGIAFVLVGHAFGYLVALPIQLGWFPDFLPGSLSLMFIVLGAVGCFLVALWASGRGGVAYLVLPVLILLSLFHSLLMLEKSGFILTLLLIGLGFLLRKTTLLRLVVLALSLALSLAFITPPVTQARLLHSSAYMDLTGGSIEERIGYHVDYLDGFRLPRIGAAEDSSFLRLHYLPYAAFVVAQYDAGSPSHRIQSGLYALVPRVIWPDKPQVSDIGSELNFLVTGSDTSALGATLYGDLYWNFGWAGLLLLIPTGIYLWWASLVAKEIVQSRDWLMMPFVLLVFMIGMSVDNHFVVKWLSPAVISVIMLGALRLANQVVFPEPAQRDARLSVHAR